MVNAPGTYTLPLVYGNAVKNGGIHSAAYTSAVSGNYIITNFVNHLDARITDPYIYNNAGCTPPAPVSYGRMLTRWLPRSNSPRTVIPQVRCRSFDDPAGQCRRRRTDASGMIMWSWQYLGDGLHAGRRLEKGDQLPGL